MVEVENFAQGQTVQRPSKCYCVAIESYPPQYSTHPVNMYPSDMSCSITEARGTQWCLRVKVRNTFDFYYSRGVCITVHVSVYVLRCEMGVVISDGRKLWIMREKEAFKCSWAAHFMEQEMQKPCWAPRPHGKDWGGLEGYPDIEITVPFQSSLLQHSNKV